MANEWCEPFFPFIINFQYQMLLTFYYYRSQKTAQFPKESGLNAQLSGMSLTGLAAGPILGFSANPRTVLKFKNELALKHTNYVSEQVEKACEVNFTFTAPFNINVQTLKCTAQPTNIH